MADFIYFPLNQSKLSSRTAAVCRRPLGRRTDPNGRNLTIFEWFSHPKLLLRPELAAVAVWCHAFMCEAAGRQPCDLASNGSVMRCAVSGAVGVGAGAGAGGRPLTLGEVTKNTVAMSRITHADPRCAADVAFLATLVHQLIRWRVPDLSTS